MEVIKNDLKVNNLVKETALSTTERKKRIHVLKPKILGFVVTEKTSILSVACNRSNINSH